MFNNVLESLTSFSNIFLQWEVFPLAFFAIFLFSYHTLDKIKVFLRKKANSIGTAVTKLCLDAKIKLLIGSRNRLNQKLHNVL